MLPTISLGVVTEGQEEKDVVSWTDTDLPLFMEGQPNTLYEGSSVSRIILVKTGVFSTPERNRPATEPGEWLFEAIVSYELEQAGNIEEVQFAYSELLFDIAED